MSRLRIDFTEVIKMNKDVMMYAEKDGIRLEIIQDEGYESPREWDNLGTMVCGHKKYTLGDKNFNFDDYDCWNAVRNGECGKEKDIIALRLFLYDHSGLSIATYPHGQHMIWDCGQVGWIYVDKAKIRKEYGVKRIDKKLRQKVEDMLKAEVDTYSDYLSGEVYGFKLVKIDENGDEVEEIDSCWGFFGSDVKTNGIADNIREEYKELVEALKYA